MTDDNLANLTRYVLFELAMGEYGVTEYPGEKHNPRILKYFTDIGKLWVDTDETAWCSAWLNWLCWRLALPKSGELDARSWCHVGHKVEDPRLGDIAIFWRVTPQDWRGHVGLFINHQEPQFINVLGGNQNNKVCIAPYPDYKLIEYRRIIG